MCSTLFIFRLPLLGFLSLPVWSSLYECESGSECEVNQETFDTVSLLQVSLDVLPTSLKDAPATHIVAKGADNHTFPSSQQSLFFQDFVIQNNQEYWSSLIVRTIRKFADFASPEPAEAKRKTVDGAFDGRKCVYACAVVTIASVVVSLILRRYAPHYLSPFCYAWIYIAVSSVLILLNKYIMSDTVFPFAMSLTTMHMTTTWLGLFALYRMRPDMFPAMEMAEKGPTIFGVAYCFPQCFIPLGVFFAIGLFGGNAALHYCTVPFLQFMKETNAAWVFSLSVLVGLQQMTRPKVFTIIWIVTGASLTITGQLQFALLGFMLQTMSQVGEVSKNVLGEWMMTSSNFRLDALTYTMSLASMTLFPLAIGTACTYEPRMVTSFVANWHLLALDCFVALCLNISGSLLIKNCSAVSFVLAGVLKDIIIVVVASYIFGNVLTGQQIVGFIVCVSGIFAFSSIKIKPEWWNCEPMKT